jgi:hypothetical protein
MQPGAKRNGFAQTALNAFRTSARLLGDLEKQKRGPVATQRVVVERVSVGDGGQAGALVQLVADRLEVGRREYGPLRVADDPRDWQREALEELADAAVYLGTEAVKDVRDTALRQDGGHVHS